MRAFLTAISHRGLMNCFLTAILHRALRNYFFSTHLISVFYLDFYIPFLFGLLFPLILFGLLHPLSIWKFFFIFFFFNSFSFFFNYLFLFKLGHILDFFQFFFSVSIYVYFCRFLELPSKVSTSLETLMDHIGVLYKFHDRPITYLYNTLHYFEHRIRERHTLKKTLVSSIVGSLKDVRPAGWCLTADYQGLLERSPKDNEEWKPGPDYYVRLVGRLVRSLQVS